MEEGDGGVEKEEKRKKKKQQGSRRKAPNVVAHTANIWLFVVPLLFSLLSPLLSNLHK